MPYAVSIPQQKCIADDVHHFSFSNLQNKLTKNISRNREDLTTYDLQTSLINTHTQSNVPKMKEYIVFSSIYRLFTKIDKLGQKPHFNNFNSFKE